MAFDWSFNKKTVFDFQRNNIDAEKKKKTGIILIHNGKGRKTKLGPGPWFWPSGNPLFGLELRVRSFLVTGRTLTSADLRMAIGQSMESVAEQTWTRFLLFE